MSRYYPPYLLINPESKLWIGVFKHWVHAWQHLRKRFSEEQRESWFVIRLEEWHYRYGDEPGWLKYDRPIYLRMHQTCEHRDYRTRQETHAGIENLVR